MKGKMSQLLASQQSIPKEKNFNLENIQSSQKFKQRQSFQDTTSINPISPKNTLDRSYPRRRTSFLQQQQKIKNIKDQQNLQQLNMNSSSKLGSLPSIKNNNINTPKHEENNFMSSSIKSIKQEQLEDELKENEKKEKIQRKRISLKKINSKELQKKKSLQYDVEERHQYYPIDMQMATNYIITKSKNIKEKIEIEEISEDFIEKNIIKSDSFRIKYHSLLQKLCNDKKINPQFRNVQKKEFQKLETFVINQIMQAQKLQSLNEKILLKRKSYNQSMLHKIQDMEEQIRYENNCVWQF